MWLVELIYFLINSKNKPQCLAFLISLSPTLTHINQTSLRGNAAINLTISVYKPQHFLQFSESHLMVDVYGGSKQKGHVFFLQECFHSEQKLFFFLWNFSSAFMFPWILYSLNLLFDSVIMCDYPSACPFFFPVSLAVNKVAYMRGNISLCMMWNGGGISLARS